MKWISSVQFSRSVVSDSLWPHELQHARLPLTISLSCWDSCPSSQWAIQPIVLCRPLLLLPSVSPSIRVFSNELALRSVQFSSVAQLRPTLCDPTNCSTPGLPVHHQLLEPAQTRVHRVSDAIQPSHSQIELTYDPAIPLLGIHTEK